MIRHNKLLLLVTIIAVLALSVTGSFAASDKDETYSKLAEQLTSLMTLRKSLSANNAKIQQVTDRLSELQGLEDNAKTQRKKKKVEGRTTALNKKTEALEQEIADKTQEIESLRAQLNNGEDVRSWHKKAKSQVIAWNFLKSSRQVVLTVLDRKSRKTSTKTARFRTRGEDKFYLIDKLPEGLQIVVPEGWTVNVDSRAGFVAKIEDSENIAGSALDNESNKDSNNGKTFTSGEAFIILRQSSMTIRPPEESAESVEIEEEESDSGYNSEPEAQNPSPSQINIDTEDINFPEPETQTTYY
ncbi:MAG: hypothetical protein IJP48_05000 [Synergistaceae bacterium]|nr:hypothetical protein [Synergistaceae bacterium]